MKIRGNTIGTPIKPEKNILKATDLTEEEKAQARENIGAAAVGETGGEVPPTDELVQTVIDALPVYDGSYTDDKENGGSYYTKEEVDNLIDAAIASDTIFKPVTQEEYEALVEAGEVDETTLYMIVESGGV